MTNVDYKENDKLIIDMIKLRDKCKKSKRKTVHKKYEHLRELCINKFEYLIEKRTRRYQAFSNYDDLKQDGRIALMSAINSFNPERGNFYCWAKQYVDTKISREANRHSTMKIPMDVAKNTQPYKVSQLPILVDSDPDAHSSYEGEQIKTVITKAINNLPEEQARVIKMRYELINSRSSSIKKICQDLKISRENCVRLLDEAFENLKEELQHYDFAEN